MSDYHQNRTAEILKTIPYATVATVTENGEPWNSPVAHTIDSQLNVYWASDKENQHSKNIRNNGKAFIVIYDSTVPEGDGEGVYIEADVTELSDPSDILYARRLKKGVDYQGKVGEFLGDEVRRIYRATPKRVWMNDAEVEDGTFIRDYKVEVLLQELGAEWQR